MTCSVLAAFEHCHLNIDTTMISIANNVPRDLISQVPCSRRLSYLGFDLELENNELCHVAVHLVHVLTALLPYLKQR